MKRTQRWIALLLTLAMALTLVPPVLAAEEVQTEPVAVEAVDAEGAEPVEEAAEEAEERVVPQAISAIDLSNVAEVRVHNDQTTYTGKAIEPSVSVKCNDKWLQAGTDYQLHDGQGNDLNIIDAGAYTLCIEGIGAYTGRAHATFTVKPKMLSVKETVTFDNQIKVKLSWEDCGGASCRYSVLYSEDGEHYQTAARSLSECSWTDDGSLTGGIDQEKNRWYQIKVDYSDVARTVSVGGSMLYPHVSIQCDSEAEGIWAKWYPDDGALYYDVTDTKGNKHRLDGNVTKYLDSTATKNGAYYTMSITAYYRINGNVQTAEVTAQEVRYQANPYIRSIVSNKGDVVVAFDPNEASSAHCVQHRAELYRDGKRVDSKNWNAQKKDYVLLTDTGAAKLTSGKTYRYSVVMNHYNKIPSPINGSGLEFTRTSKEVSFYVPSKPTITKLECTSSGLRLAWKPDQKADGYEIRRRAGNGKWKLLTRVSKGSTSQYLDKKVDNGTVYTYKVFAYTNAMVAGSYDYSVSSGERALAYLSRPSGVKLTASAKTIKISCKKNSKASGYQVYRLDENGKITKVFKIKKNSTTSYTDKTAGTNTYGKCCTYVVIATLTKGKKTYQSIPSTTVTYWRPSAPKISVSAGNNALVLDWSKVKNADGYYVWRKSGNGKWKKVTTVKTNDKSSYGYRYGGLTNGTTYTFKVEAYIKTKDGKEWKTAGREVKYVYLTTPTLKGGRSGGNGILTWNQNKKAAGYHIYRQINGGKWERAKSIGTSKTVKWVDAKLTTGAEYRYYIRAYQKVGSTYYYSGDSQPVRFTT